MLHRYDKIAYPPPQKKEEDKVKKELTYHKLNNIMKNSLLVKLWIFLNEAVIHALLLSLHLKCFLFVFASRL